MGLFHSQTRRHMIFNNIINPLFSGNPQIDTFTNSEDPDELLHNVAFYQGLHYLLR